MRLALVLSLGLLLAGCVPTADFVGLRDEVRQVQAENRKLKETGTELRKRLEEQDRGGDLAKRLDALDAKVEGMRIKQQGFDQKLGELLRQAEETARRQEAPGVRGEGSAKPGGPGGAKESKDDAQTGLQPQASGPEPQAALTPTALYNQAYNDYLKGNYDLAISGFGELLKKFPGVSQSAHAQYWIGRSHYNKKEYRQALETYERVTAEYPKSDKVPAALFEMGVAHAELGDVVKAKERFKLVIEKYPQSNEASRARLKLADLK